MPTQKPAIFITGASAGIGKATAELFASKGWFVGLFDVDEAGLARLQKQLGDEASMSQRLDVTDEASVAAGIAAFSACTGGQMQILFNNAGILDTTAFADSDPGMPEKMYAVNVVGLMRCARLALPLLEKTANARVINMSSASANFGIPGFSIYSSSKHAVRGFTEALNIEWGGKGIHVCDLMPTFVNTPMVRNASNQATMQKLGINLTPEKIAQTVWKAKSGKRIHWPVGVDGWALALLVTRLPTRVSAGLTKILTG